MPEVQLVGSQFQIHTTIAGPTGGGWIAVFEAFGRDGQSDGLGRRFDADGIQIGGAAAFFHVQTQADVDHRIGVTVSFTDGFGTLESTTSAEGGIVRNLPVWLTGSVAITGAAVPGGLLGGAGDNRLFGRDGPDILSGLGGGTTT